MGEKIHQVEFDDIEKEKGDSDDEKLNTLTDEEIEKAAKNDPDFAVPTDEELKEFKRVRPKK